MSDQIVDSLRDAPDASTDEFDGGEVVFGTPAGPGGDSSAVLDAFKEALDQVALSVEPAREGKTLLTVVARRDVRPVVLVCGSLTDGADIAALVSQQSFRVLTVVDLTTSQATRDGTTISVNEAVNRRPIGTPYRRAKGTPLGLGGLVDAGRVFRAAGGVGRA